MSIILENWSLLLLFFTVALLYSSVGFGGGSSYLAIMALFGLEFKFLRATALLCNLTVVSNGSFQYYRKGFLDLKKALPLVVLSVPLAYLGGKTPLSENTFFILLGFTLLLAAVLVWFQPYLINKINFKTINSENVILNLVIGAFIGYISGVVGIGGGIFLSPILYIINWDKPQKISAMASFFILVNSISGLVGQFQTPDFSMDWGFAFALIVAVAVGGQIGTYLGTVKFNQNMIRKATAVLIAYVSYTLLTKYL